MSDNIFTSEILTICSLAARRGGSESEYVQLIADTLVNYAQQCMRNKTRTSPFERK
jgi:protein phosphatase PTC7